MQTHRILNTSLRVGLTAAVLFAAGLSFLPLIAEAQSSPSPQPWSLVATFHADYPFTNCCTGKFDYHPHTTYSTPAKCMPCHTGGGGSWSEWEGPPEQYAGLPCLRFDE